MSQNTIPGSEKIANINVLASAVEPANIYDPLRDIKENINEQIIREINKPIFEFVGATGNRGEFIRGTRLIRRDK